MVIQQRRDKNLCFMEFTLWGRKTINKEAGKYIIICTMQLIYAVWDDSDWAAFLQRWIKAKVGRTRKNQSHEDWGRAFQASKQVGPNSRGKKELACLSNCSNVAGAEQGAGGEEVGASSQRALNPHKNWMFFLLMGSHWRIISREVVASDLCL